MKNAHVINAAQLAIMLNELRLPTIKTPIPRRTKIRSPDAQGLPYKMRLQTNGTGTVNINYLYKSIFHPSGQTPM